MSEPTVNVFTAIEAIKSVALSHEPNHDARCLVCLAAGGDRQARAILLLALAEKRGDNSVLELP